MTTPRGRLEGALRDEPMFSSDFGGDLERDELIDAGHDFHLQKFSDDLQWFATQESRQVPYSDEASDFDYPGLCVLPALQPQDINQVLAPRRERAIAFAVVWID